MKKQLIIFGYGYTGQATATAFWPDIKLNQWKIYGTSRKLSNDQHCQIINYSLEDVEKTLKNTTHILVCIAPNEYGDIVLQDFKELLAKSKNIQWIGYLSSTSVYGNCNGSWVDENTKTSPTNQRGILRKQAENEWLKFGSEYNITTNIFRLAGIYGPERNALNQIIQNKAKSIKKNGQVFSRIHVEDIANIIIASMNQSVSSEIYNLADNYPCSSIEVNNYAAKLLKTTPPKIIEYNDAKLSSKAQEFYKDNKRVSNKKIKEKLGIKLKYPTYREGIKQLLL